MNQTHNANRRARIRRHRRGAAVVLEVILVLPILLIVLLGIVEYGVLISNLQYVEMASRSGSHVASRTASGAVPNELNNAALPAAILTAVNEELDRMNPGTVARQVYLEHNVKTDGTAGPMVKRCGGVTNAPCPYRTVNAPSPPVGATYVRVTVFVDLPRVTPNALASLGLDFSTSVVQQTTTMMWLGP